MKKIVIGFVVLVVLLMAGMGIATMFMKPNEGTNTPENSTQKAIEAPAEGKEVWTGGGTEAVNAGLELSQPPLEVLIHQVRYAGLTTARSTVSVRATINNLGPVGLGAWYNRPGAFSLYSSSGGAVPSSMVKVVKATGAMTELAINFAQVPSQPLTANQVALAVRVSAASATNVAFGLTPPTENSLDAEKIEPAATPPAPAAKQPAAKKPVKKVVKKPGAKKATAKKKQNKPIAKKK